MITSIQLQGIRGIRQGELADFTPLVVLVGKNGCGKSTVLDALYIIANPFGRSEGIRTIIERHKGVEMGAPWLFWRLGNDPQMFFHQIKLQTDYPCERFCSLSGKSQQNGNFIVTSTLTNSVANKTEQLQEEPIIFHASGGYSISAGKNVTPLPDITELEMIDAPLGNSMLPLHELYSAAVKLGRRAEAKSILTEIVPGMVDIEILTEGNRPMVHLVFDTHSVPAPLAGDGIYSLIRLVLEIASRKSGVVLIEEPETHKHPGAIHQAAKVIWAAVRRGIQVFLTTHSLELIDMLLAESRDDLAKYSLYHLRLDQGQLFSSLSSGDDIALARGKIQDDLR